MSNNNSRLTTSLILTALVIAIGGCSKKSNTENALNNAVQAMAEPSAPAAHSTPAATVNQTPPVQTEAAQQMSQTVTSYKSGNYEDAVTRMLWLRSVKGVTPEQLRAIQEASAAVMGDLYMRASKGDARAQAAVKQFEARQNQN